MDADDRDQALFEHLVAAMGAPPLAPEEVAAVLRLAKVVADASQRRFAPLSCYAAGMVIGAAGDDRPARLEALVDEVTGAATATATPATPDTTATPHTTAATAATATTATTDTAGGGGHG